MTMAISLAIPPVCYYAYFSIGDSGTDCDLHRVPVSQWGDTQQGAGTKKVEYNPLYNGLNTQSLPTTGISQKKCFK